ncbi:MAG: hypothetical protein NTW12_10590 [Deltaproteobacteria bacterium]|nr:hypothetical protein [Deltaproteobacteria bacterium]
MCDHKDWHIQKINHIYLMIILTFALTNCVFIPQQVDIDSIESRIVYPRDSFKAKKMVQYEKFVDLRPAKDHLGSRRNLMMMKTANVSLKGDMSNLTEAIIKNTFASRGIREGTSPYAVRVRIVEVTANYSGPGTIFIQVSLTLSVIDNNINKIIYQKNLKGYSEDKPTAISSSSLENAFVGAMNQIADQTDQIALELLNII